MTQSNNMKLVCNKNIAFAKRGIICCQVSYFGRVTGVAYNIMDRFPDAYLEYRDKCYFHKQNLLGLGQILDVGPKTKSGKQIPGRELYVAALFAQSEINLYQSQTNYKALRQALGYIKSRFGEQIESDELPLLIPYEMGVEANGDWDKILKIIYEMFGSHVYIIKED